MYDLLPLLWSRSGAPMLRYSVCCRCFGLEASAKMYDLLPLQWPRSRDRRTATNITSQHWEHTSRPQQRQQIVHLQHWGTTSKPKQRQQTNTYTIKICADTECFLKITNSYEGEYTIKYQEHFPNPIGAKLMVDLLCHLLFLKEKIVLIYCMGF